MNAQAGIEFAKWLKTTHPKIYAQAVAAADGATLPPAPGLADKHGGGWLNTFVNTAGSLGAAYLQLKNQRDQMKINLERAKMNQPPIDIAGAPVLTTNVQLAPETVSQITASAGMNINKILVVGAAALAVFMIFR